MCKDLTENEYNEHVFSKLAHDKFVSLGIDMSDWKFGSCTIAIEEQTEYGMLDFFNNKMEDHCLSLEFIRLEDGWKIDQIEIIQD